MRIFHTSIEIPWEITDQIAWKLYQLWQSTRSTLKKKIEFGRVSNKEISSIKTGYGKTPAKKIFFYKCSKMYEIFTRCWANRDILLIKKLSSGEFPIMNYRLLSQGIGKNFKKLV